MWLRRATSLKLLNSHRERWLKNHLHIIFKSPTKKKKKRNTGGITPVNVKCELVTYFQHNMTIEDFLNIKMQDSLDHWPLSHSYRLGCTITPFNIP